MEILSYIIHRYLFHGVLWRIHQTHHSKSHSRFELNDIFSIGFSATAIYLLWIGSEAPLQSIPFAIGTGVSIYGVLYFIIHDLFTHRRFLPFQTSNVLMRLVRRAHQRHHQSLTHKGQEPYGLFLFPYKEFGRK
ncbi:MAG: fatty acid hydroxylase [Candidatus Kapabacteria bacterium]|nr:fatty acid hydroxylase [Candidatus Kapabacteria bacterium]